MKPSDIRFVVAFTAATLSTSIDTLLDREWSDVLGWFHEARRIARLRNR